MKRRLTVIVCSLLLAMAAGNAYAQYDKEYFFYMGRRFIVDNRYSDAIQKLNVLLMIDPSAHEAYFLRGVAKYNLDDLLGAEQDFSQAIHRNPVYTLAYRYRGITRSRLGNYKSALEDFNEAISLRPDLPYAYHNRAAAYMMNHQFKEALADFDEFIKYEPKIAEVYIDKGTCLLLMKDTTAAMELYNQAIRLNRQNPVAYNRRGGVYSSRGSFGPALSDFNSAIAADSAYIPSYINRALVYANTNHPTEAINDFSRSIALDSTISISYFNRAILRSQIGDYNKALEDYNKVAELAPGNVLVFYNRGGMNSHLGNIDDAISDYTRSIELYPDFANAYLNRASLKYLKRDTRGAEKDKKTAEAKIAEYRSKLNDSTFSIYADTSRQFNTLMSFDSKFGGSELDDPRNGEGKSITLLPLFRFTLIKTEGVPKEGAKYENPSVDGFLSDSGMKYLALTNRESNLPADSILAIEARLTAISWKDYFSLGITQASVKQYTNSVGYYTKAIEENPSNPFLYLNRSTTQSEMTDFISSIDNNYNNINLDTDPASRLKSVTTRTYSYDEAIGDLNKAAKLLPGFAHIYYNRANLYCLSGDMPKAIEDYTRAIELYPHFAEAYYNRGLVQIYLKDTRKGCLDISKAGELGISEAYDVLKRYSGIVSK